ncbi:DUF5819 family protein [Streptomyces sp. NBC_00340]|nr:DUF5819 family protein [Streptomyces sp. NBC_00340]
MKKTGWVMSRGIGPASVQEIRHSDIGPTPQECPAETPRATGGRSILARAGKAGLTAAVILGVATTLVHVLLVFLHVAPTNTLSKRYSPMINAWVYPFFEQNWRLFAPDPDSVNRQILARTAHTGSGGSSQVSDWFDLTAVDDAAVEHDPFPSHTAQNMLRRAWTSYVDTHGSDDEAHTERALMMQKYLSNIAAQRVAGRRAGTFDFIQLRVVTRPIAASGPVAGDRPPTPTENRLLPWWKVTPDGN